MTRKRRDPPPIVHPLQEQVFLPKQAKRALIQVVREIHGVHYDIDGFAVEAVLAEAIERARREREEEVES
jgi:hypothetical protein